MSERQVISRFFL